VPINSLNLHNEALSFTFNLISAIMTIKEKYEGAFVWVLVIVFIGLACLGLWLLKTITVLPIITMYAVSLLGFLYINSFDLSRSKEDPTALTVATLTIAVICCCFVLFGKHKERAMIAKLFVNGKIEKEYYVHEYDNGATETTYNYILKPTKSSREAVIEIIDWAIVILSLLCIAINLKTLSKADKLRRQQKFKEKYPNWKGEIPILED